MANEKNEQEVEGKVMIFQGVFYGPGMDRSTEDLEKAKSAFQKHSEAMRSGETRARYEPEGSGGGQIPPGNQARTAPDGPSGLVDSPVVNPVLAGAFPEDFPHRDTLMAQGYQTVGSLRDADDATLTAVTGISKSDLKKVRSAADKAEKEQQEQLEASQDNEGQ